MGTSQIGGAKKAQGGKSGPHAWFLHRESEVSAYSDPKSVAEKKPKKKKVDPILGFYIGKVN